LIIYNNFSEIKIALEHNPVNIVSDDWAKAVTMKFRVGKQDYEDIFWVRVLKPNGGHGGIRTLEGP